MEYETGKFKRYVRNREGKEVTQVGVSGLSVNSKFKDDEEIIILSKEDFNQLESKANNSTEIIQNLENQLGEAKVKIQTLETTAPEPNPENPKYINRVIDLQEEINNRNQLLFNTQNTIKNIFSEVNTAKGTTEKNIISLLSELQNDINIILELTKELPNQVNGINSSIDNTSWIKWTFSKNKFKIVLDMDKVNKLEAKLVEFTNKDIVQLANNVITPVEIPTENLDLNQLYISIGNDNSDNKTIPSKVLTPKK